MQSKGLMHLGELTSSGSHVPPQCDAADSRMGWSLLHHCIEDCRCGDQAAARLLSAVSQKIPSELFEVETGVDHRPPKMTALCMLVKGNTHPGERTDALRVLIQRGAKITAVDSYGNTPLHLAAGTASVWCVAQLLSAGCPLNKANERGQWPLDCLGRTSDGRCTNRALEQQLERGGCQRNPNWDQTPGDAMHKVSTYVVRKSSFVELSAIDVRDVRFCRFYMMAIVFVGRPRHERSRSRLRRRAQSRDVEGCTRIPLRGRGVAGQAAGAGVS